MQSAKLYYERMYREIRTMNGRREYPIFEDTRYDNAYSSYLDRYAKDHLNYRELINPNTYKSRGIRGYMNYLYPKNPMSIQSKPLSIWDVLPLA